jgi:hypothetical protein
MTAGSPPLTWSRNDFLHPELLGRRLGRPELQLAISSKVSSLRPLSQQHNIELARSFDWE